MILTVWIRRIWMDMSVILVEKGASLPTCPTLSPHGLVQLTKLNHRFSVNSCASRLDAEGMGGESGSERQNQETPRIWRHVIPAIRSESERALIS